MKEKKTPGSLLFDSWFLTFNVMSDADLGKFIKALGKHIQGEPYELPEHLRDTAKVMFQTIMEGRANYNAKCSQNSENASKRWNRSDEVPMDANGCDRITDVYERTVDECDRSAVDMPNSKSKSKSNNKERVSKDTPKKSTFSLSDVPKILDTIEIIKDRQDIKDIILDFYEVRKKLKKPIATEHALRLLVDDAIKFSNGDPDKIKRIFENSVANSWQGVFPLKEDKPAPKPTQPETEPFNDWLQRRMREEEEKKNGNINVPQAVGYIPTGLPEAGQ